MWEDGAQGWAKSGLFQKASSRQHAGKSIPSPFSTSVLLVPSPLFFFSKICSSLRISHFLFSPGSPACLSRDSFLTPCSLLHTDRDCSLPCLGISTLLTQLLNLIFSLSLAYCSFKASLIQTRSFLLIPNCLPSPPSGPHFCKVLSLMS